jgi:hypothetical protein
MKKELFQKYGELKSQIVQLSAEAKELEKDIFPQMLELKENGVDNVKSDYGTFFLILHKTWIYSKDVKTKEAELKAIKKSEEESGKASFKESQSFSFRTKSNGK